MTEIASAALSYAERGWRVFPLYEIEGGVCACGSACSSPGKHPRTAHGVKDASNDPTIVKGWWHRWPGANVGIATGDGLAVVDLDVGREKDGIASWMALGVTVETLECTTGGGGHHLYFDSGAGAVRNSVGRVGKGIDVRGDRGYVVAPPSSHASGAVYAWVGDADVAELPAEVRRLNSAKPRQTGTASGGGVVSLGTGERNDGLVQLAGWLRSKNCSRVEMTATLKAANLERCKPPLADAEVEGIIESVMGYPAGGGFEHTDAGNADRLVHEYGTRFRYVTQWDCWLVWDERRWFRTNDVAMHGFALKMAERMKLEAGQLIATDADDGFGKALMKWGRVCSNWAKVQSSVKTVRALTGVQVRPGDLDSDLLSLNLANGTLDLRAGRLREHCAPDLITTLTGVEWDPEAECPRWLQFLSEVFAGDQELVDYVQRAVGYSLTGSVQEHALFFCYGSGCNGKSTFLKVLQDMLGECASAGPPGLLQQRKGGSKPHPTEQAVLLNKRLVICQELEEGVPWAESVVKTLTGGDVISTRRMHEDFWDLRQTHKLWVAGNAKPIVKGATDGIWRRMKLLPFLVSFRGHENTELEGDLRTELAGILRWAVAGCLAWQRDGLQEPKIVQAATQDYRDEMDLLGPFFEECFELVDPRKRGEQVSRKTLVQAYRVWCNQYGENGMGTQTLYKSLRDRGFIEHRVAGGRLFCGLRLKEGWNAARVIH